MEKVRDVKKPKILTEEEFFKGLEEAEEDIRDGRVKSMEEVHRKWRKEIGISN